jgi:hypothetical protein
VDVVDSKRNPRLNDKPMVYGIFITSGYRLRSLQPGLNISRLCPTAATKYFNAYEAFNGMEPLVKTSREVFCSDTYYLPSVYRTKTKSLLMKGSVLSYIGAKLFKGANQVFLSSV